MAFEDACKGTVGPDHPDPTDQNGTKPGCEPNARGDGYCPPTSADKTCAPFQLSTNRDSCFIDNVVNEALNVGGASFRVYKLLGVHEQCKTVDVTGKGQPLSNGDAPGFPATQAFDTFITEWRSLQKGDGVLASAYIGYDFGEIKTNDDSRQMYGIEAQLRRHITALAIKQSSTTENRVTRARVERSDDGQKWIGVTLINLPDDDCLNTITFRDSVPSRYWRLRPVEFNGSTGDYWGVQALQMFHNYTATHISNIQDKIFLENRDRDYADEPFTVKASYDLIDVQSELSRFGIELPAQTIYATVSFSACVAIIGRPLIIGDIIEIPSEAQWSAEMRKILKWMEVTDVAWSTEGYTPGWQPTLLRVVLQPAFHSQETQDIFGDLAEREIPDELGLVEGYGDGRDPNHQDYSDISQTVIAHARDLVPESGREFTSQIRAWEDEEVQSFQEQAGPYARSLQSIGLNPTAVYVEDAMPPNNAPFTEGTEFPDNPAHGDYHRLTYEGLSRDVPARLYRYSQPKGRWIFLEKDRRAEFDPNEPRLQEFLVSTGRRPHNAVLTREKIEKCPPNDDNEES